MWAVLPKSLTSDILLQSISQLLDLVLFLFPEVGDGLGKAKINI